jgi:hypothetical protein
VRKGAYNRRVLRAAIKEKIRHINIYIRSVSVHEPWWVDGIDRKNKVCVCKRLLLSFHLWIGLVKERIEFEAKKTGFLTKLDVGSGGSGDKLPKPESCSSCRFKAIRNFFLQIRSIERTL